MNPSDPNERRSTRTPRVFQRARSQLGRAVGDALSGSLEAVAGRLRDGLFSNALVDIGKVAEPPKQRLSRVLLSDRRSAAKGVAIQAQPVAPAPAAQQPAPVAAAADVAMPAPATAEAAPLTAAAEARARSTAWSQVRETRADDNALAPPTAADAAAQDTGACEEPIRTRSMARLLAGQGHHKRALAIYDALLATDPTNAELRAEAAALRERTGS